ncbi:MAG TPA: glycosyltransferase, partial [Candidatus Babeliales bacterium]|nr:glycosyltransferase [Candidatus Babeliales bacterium]
FSNTTNKTIRSNEQKDFNILFTGAMDYFPNEDGVLYFYYKIWPIIKDKLPQSKFYIVGGNPSKKLKTITGKDKDVLLTGYVDDVRQYVWKADVFVAPLRIARGIQNKILEALAAGLPVVATSRASQGIGCNGNEFLFIENSAVKFAERTISFADKRLSGKAVEKRESFLKQKYDWSGNLIELEKILNIGGTRYS